MVHRPSWPDDARISWAGSNVPQSGSACGPSATVATIRLDTPIRKQIVSNRHLCVRRPLPRIVGEPLNSRSPHSNFARELLSAFR
jgi:hypothetical protein